MPPSYTFVILPRAVTLTFNLLTVIPPVVAESTPVADAVIVYVPAELNL